jgi:hypothetical protein
MGNMKLTKTGVVEDFCRKLGETYCLEFSIDDDVATRYVAHPGPDDLTQAYLDSLTEGLTPARAHRVCERVKSSREKHLGLYALDDALEEAKTSGFEIGDTKKAMRGPIETNYDPLELGSLGYAYEVDCYDITRSQAGQVFASKKRGERTKRNNGSGYFREKVVYDRVIEVAGIPLVLDLRIADFEFKKGPSVKKSLHSKRYVPKLELLGEAFKMRDENLGREVVEGPYPMAYGLVVPGDVLNLHKEHDAVRRFLDAGGMLIPFSTSVIEIGGTIRRIIDEHNAPEVLSKFKGDGFGNVFRF